jgi:hypothetical protein
MRGQTIGSDRMKPTIAIVFVLCPVPGTGCPYAGGGGP